MWAFRLGVLEICACSGKSADTGSSETECVPTQLVATDIDETLTTADAEWISQLADPTYDPLERPAAAQMMNQYADAGYRVVYITARGEDTVLQDGRSGRQATLDWLVGHGFPATDTDLYLAEGIGASGDAAVTYKSGVLDDLAANGQTTAWAYGNADTDILAFQAAGIPDDHIFLVGELAGTMGVVGIPDDDAYRAHISEQFAQVVATDCAGRL